MNLTFLRYFIVFSLLLIIFNANSGSMMAHSPQELVGQWIEIKKETIIEFFEALVHKSLIFVV